MPNEHDTRESLCRTLMCEFGEKQASQRARFSAVASLPSAAGRVDSSSVNVMFLAGIVPEFKIVKL